MHFRLRTLLILMTVGPPMMVGAWWVLPKVAETNKQSSIADFDKLIDLICKTVRPDSWDDIGGPGKIDEFPTRCFVLVESEDDPVGPDPCGRSYSFRPYAPDDVDSFSSIPVTAIPDEDPFAIPK